MYVKENKLHVCFVKIKRFKSIGLRLCAQVQKKAKALYDALFDPVVLFFIMTVIYFKGFKFTSC